MERHMILGVCLLLVVGHFQSAVSQGNDLEPTLTPPSDSLGSPTSFSEGQGTNDLQGSTVVDYTLAEDPSLEGRGLTSINNRTDDVVSIIEEDASFLTLGRGSREGHFSGTSRVVLPVTLNLRGYTSISFRTCRHGTLLSQEGSDGDTLVLGINEEGTLVLSIIRHGQPYTTTLGRRLNNNVWHRVYLKFELGVLRLGVDQSTVVVANTTSSSAPLIDLGLWSPSPQLTIGNNFTGCILQGAGTELTNPLALHVGVEWDLCPLPDGTDCSGYVEDHCFSQPCRRHGQCISTQDSYVCNCYTRYSGEHCEEDNGPLCLRPEFQCQNGGLCQEDRQGNMTTCACRTGFTGSMCQVPIDESFCDNDSNPCQNNATCTVTSFADTYECLCLPGFSGDHCEVNDDNCVYQPCWHGGICIDGINDFTCNCEGTGYEGAICEENVDECSVLDPCLNGATCFDLYGDYECACAPGFGGKHCEVEVHECSSDPCQNGGTCTDLQNAYRCTCMLGFEGDSCEHNINDCYNVTCPENSYCMDGVSEHVCRCSPGFSGSPPACVETDECESSPCLNGASCYDQDNSYTCICTPGFTGSNCEVNIDDCTPDPCQNGGTCEDGIDTYTCHCPAGFEGDYCEDNRNECALNVCVHAQNCRDLIGDYECDCEAGWSGKNCDEEVDECASSPCLNGASCKDRVNGFDCTCPPGFAGETCQTDINECESNPCLNGGICIDGLNNYTCECGEAYMGTNCEEEYDACASNPCQNSASCITTRGLQDFYCECILGFEGLYCSNNINDCFDVTCSDGKVCYDMVNSYECRCPEGFTGENCSVNIDECESSPCLNGGECHDGMANYSCVCPPGYTGHNCENDVDECELLRPCVNGICENTNGSYQCYCRPGFSGDHCNLEFDECLSRPCRNSGTCINRINGYECVCQPGFTGTDCDIDIDECASAPCQNNATCDDGIATFTCECLPGFADKLCSTNIDECESDPCMNEGVCTDGINHYTCNCSDTGFKGPQCEVNIDDCESSPCQHGSTCSDFVKDYKCLCYDGYTGKNCEKDIPECASFPCLNGASCLERSNLTLYDLNIFSNFTYEAAGGFICECIPGFTGDLCEININECESNPCVNGICYDDINTYSCECWPGYQGQNCEIEINECELYTPCMYGSCVDKVADYDCVCEDGFGGKNCSVELLGCHGIDCLNSGTCEALLINETLHDFLCHCEHGFTGRNCQESTTLSLSGNSYVLINSQRQEGYELAFRFRTTLANGILAVGQGETYIKLELLQGQLNFHSSLLNKWEGIFTGSDLNDGQWQNVRMSVNDSHVSLSANNESTVYPINPVQTINSSDTSFSTTVLGGATPTLKILSKGAPFFTGCMEDVMVDGTVLIPSRVPEPMRVLVEEGCPRVEQCNPNPCLNDGKCVDLWTNYQCNCERPYLGDTCQMSFTPTTFGNEDITDSLVTVVIPEVDHSTYRTHADVSMLVRTRETDGLIFYLGTQWDIDIPGFHETHILAELKESDLIIRVLLDGPEEIFTIKGLSLSDGDPHLLHVKRINSELEVNVDHKLVLNTTLSYSGDLIAQVLYLGGVPEDTAGRVKRQLGVSNFTTTVTRPHFKGTLQDIRLSNGSETRLVQPFPLENVSNVILPGENLQGVENHNVLEGTVSDDTCTPDPCENGATCSITWNDFLCTCTVGYKGKTCEDREYCAIFECPQGSECINLDDGYECLANVTLNGVNSSMMYTPSFENPPSQITEVLLDYRSQVGGVMFWVSGADANVWIGLRQSSVVIHQTNGSTSKSAFFTSNVTLDGYWHTLMISFDSSGLQVMMDDTTLLGSDIAVIIDFTSLVLNGEVMIGASPGPLTTHSLLDPSLIASTTTPTSSLLPEDSFIPQVFRGCLGATRIQGVLVPFFSQLDLINNTADNRFLRQEEAFSSIGCTVCYNEECVNGGTCSNPAEVYSCSCPVGFEGSLCEINIDECIEHRCLNGATCVDGINQYTCSCMQGYTGEFCEEDIDECATSPCKNGGICSNEVARFVCQCPEDFIGLTCEELKVKNCSNLMCLNGATCNDVYNPLTGVADNYTCTCPFGYSGNNCENITDFCKLRDIICDHGTCDLTYQGEGWECICDAGWEGIYCRENINDCQSNPCKNGATCMDGNNSFTCHCLDTWNGTICEVDVDECEYDPCKNGGACSNLQGSFECLCEEHYCGATCKLDNPCLQHNCSHDGICVHFCDEYFENQTSAFCRCPDGWGGDFCHEEVDHFPTDVDLAIIVGCVVGLMLVIAIVGLTVFLMMAKKKRQTRGTYSPSRQEFYSPRVEMGNMMKPPPEERLI
ncbi:protein crumbs isoform X2 [Panulirus ornatus]|uniref:protein crumbs isoform X2 n=1 Tax=Panulirus ornatus TaxID=150431 RepID=UPI003A8464E6